MKAKDNRSFIQPEKFKSGFTLAELITVVVIIAVLLGVLMPALSYVKKLALETKQRAQITSIEAGILIYKTDFGSYPPSHGLDPNRPTLSYPYCGAQTLAEAMFGQDLLGFHNDSKSYNIDDENYSLSTVDARKGPYLDRANIGVFTPRQIFDKDTASLSIPLVADRYVICDVFTNVSRNINIGGGNTKLFKIGTPVLYFQANLSPLYNELTFTSSSTPDDLAGNIYNYRDNYNIISRHLGRITDAKQHPLWTTDGAVFYDYIRDPMIPISSNPNTHGRPVRPDSFLLISAGFDGLYGTKDDICNFTPNLQ